MADNQAGSQVIEYVEGAKQQAQVIGRKVEDYLRSTKKFQAACDDAFNKVDDRGVKKLTLDQCADACVIFFKDISTSVDDFGEAPLRLRPTTLANGQTSLSRFRPRSFWP
jgi:hypothetical protein